VLEKIAWPRFSQQSLTSLAAEGNRLSLGGGIPAPPGSELPGRDHRLEATTAYGGVACWELTLACVLLLSEYMSILAVLTGGEKRAKRVLGTGWSSGSL